ncbi:hypothetical protein CDAR_257521 [Caerostris darwini]|uniref:Uncharacterized protein n=1 Tax=Caerostris darwini TaxID=1538125 RepID=A0AAV4TAM9_9ARAC|nr:hypothetical protein CDAR_257521 [Caerostris darwini]
MLRASVIMIIHMKQALNPPWLVVRPEGQHHCAIPPLYRYIKIGQLRFAAFAPQLRATLKRTSIISDSQFSLETYLLNGWGGTLKNWIGLLEE